MRNRITRRAMFAAISASLPAATLPPVKKRPLPRVGEFVRLLDPVTEAVIVRLTALSSASLLPAPANHFHSVRDRFLVFSSNRTGTFAPFHLNLHTGAVEQLAETGQLDPKSLTLDAAERNLFLLDGGDLKVSSLAAHRTKTLYDGVSAFALGRTSSEIALVRGGNLEFPPATVLVRDVGSECSINSAKNLCLFTTNTAADAAEFWCVPLSARAKPQLLAKGQISFPFWSPDGNSLLFLRRSPDTNRSEIRSVSPDFPAERLVAPTSQFAAFAPNRDASVFVGASASKAQPNIEILLRSVKRETTLCEHHATHPAAVTPVFSADSRRVYFASDREGSSALYSVNVESFVEPTI